MSHLDLVWIKSISIFPFLRKSTTDSDYNDEDFDFVIAELRRLSIAEQLYEIVLLEIDQKLRQEIVPDFWKRFQNSNAGNVENDHGFYQFQVAVFELYKAFGIIHKTIGRLQILKQNCQFTNPSNEVRDEILYADEILKADLLSQLPAKFNTIVYAFYSISFKVFVNSHQPISKQIYISFIIN